MTALAVALLAVLTLVAAAAWQRSKPSVLIIASPVGASTNLAAVSQVAVFDNNVYRDITRGIAPPGIDAAVEQLVSAERAAHIQALAQPLILMEIAARIGGWDRAADLRARSALGAAALHCEMRVNGQALIATMPDPETILCMTAFGQTPQQNRDMSEVILSLASHVAVVRDRKLNRPARRLVRVLRKHVALTEATFVKEMFKYVVKPAVPQLTSWAQLVKQPALAKPVLAFLRGPHSKELFARALATKSADLLGIVPTPTELDSAASSIVSTFGIALALYNEIVNRILLSGCRLTKNSRENWFWDLHLALCIGPAHSVFGRPLKLVTSDADIVEAAKSVGGASLVEPFVAYKTSLGVP